MVVDSKVEASLNYTMFLFENNILEISNRTNLDLIDNYNPLNETYTEYIVEAAGEAIRDSIEKLLARIAEIWTSFLNQATNMSKIDIRYLTRYKDIILNKPLKENVFVMHTYWTGYNTMINTDIPDFNWMTIKDNLDNDEAFIKRYFGNFASRMGENLSFSETAKIMFKGQKDPVRVLTNKIPIETMFRYCMNYTQLVNKYKSDIRKIDQAGKESIRLLKQGQSIGEACLLLEALVEKVSDGSANNKPQDPTPGQNKQETRIVDPKPTDAEKNDNDQEAKDRASEGNVKQDIEKVKRYMRICTNMLSAKLSITEEAYRAYIYLIRDHVRSYNKETNINNKAQSAEMQNTKPTEKYAGNAVTNAKNNFTPIKGVLDRINQPKNK